MFNLGVGALSNVLNSIDSAAKETLEEPKQTISATRRLNPRHADGIDGHQAQDVNLTIYSIQEKPEKQ